jgi:ActR/RegA family two-component response regulator
MPAILVADSDEEFVRSLCARLQAGSAQTLIARSASDALKSINNTGVTLVVMNIRFGGSGDQLWRQLAFRRISVLAVADGPQPAGTAEACTKLLGAFAYFEKPLNVSTLGDLLLRKVQAQLPKVSVPSVEAADAQLRTFVDPLPTLPPTPAQAVLSLRKPSTESLTVGLEEATLPGLSNVGEAIDRLAPAPKAGLPTIPDFSDLATLPPTPTARETDAASKPTFATAGPEEETNVPTAEKPSAPPLSDQETRIKPNADLATLIKPVGGAVQQLLPQTTELLPVGVRSPLAQPRPDGTQGQPPPSVFVDPQFTKDQLEREASRFASFWTFIVIGALILLVAFHFVKSRHRRVILRAPQQHSRSSTR